MTYATTFSGIGGWELGLNACGWELQWQCERDQFCRVLLNERFGVPIYDDIGTICEQSPAPVDALIGSPPCQPFSVAGKKSGTADARHLYPSFIQLVGQIKPRWVLMEQVPAILSIERGRAFGGYISGLAALRYSVVWHCIPACAIGANHQRDRIWIIAYSDRWGSEGANVSIRSGRQEQAAAESVWSSANVADSERGGWREQLRTNTEGRAVLSTERAESALGTGSSCEDVPVTARELRHWRREEGNGRAESTDGSALSDASSAGCEELNATGVAATPGHSARGFVAGGANWAVEPDVGRVANGIPFRVHRLKGLGNAVLPQIPYLIGQAINQIEADAA